MYDLQMLGTKLGKPKYILNDETATLLLGLLVLFGIPLVFLTPAPVGVWRVFEKAGKPGWAANAPIYNLVVCTAIIRKPSSGYYLCLLHTLA